MAHGHQIAEEAQHRLIHAVPRLTAAFVHADPAAVDAVDHHELSSSPQGGILSPLLTNIALSILDEHFTRKWEALGPAWTRAKRRRAGAPAYRLVVLVGGTREDADALWDEVSDVLAPMGLRLSAEKTRVVHFDEGFDFLGWRIQRRRKRGHNGKKAVYTYPRALVRRSPTCQRLLIRQC